MWGNMFTGLFFSILLVTRTKPQQQHYYHHHPHTPSGPEERNRRVFVKAFENDDRLGSTSNWYSFPPGTHVLTASSLAPVCWPLPPGTYVLASFPLTPSSWHLCDDLFPPWHLCPDPSLLAIVC